MAPASGEARNLAPQLVTCPGSELFLVGVLSVLDGRPGGPLPLRGNAVTSFGRYRPLRVAAISATGIELAHRPASPYGSP